VGFYFLDTSAAVKLYALETGSAWIRNLADPASGHYFFAARIIEVEATAALARRRRDGSLSVAQAVAALTQFRLDFTRVPHRRDRRPGGAACRTACR
jgi:predicted nucleic acid-binding protein